MAEKMLCNEPLHEECVMKDQCLKHNICPMAIAHELISGKWKILILWYLSYQTLRFSDIKRRTPQITQKMLTTQLRSLEEDGLICRTVYPVIPPKVEYSLTEIGHKIIPVLEALHSFGGNYLNEKFKNIPLEDENEDASFEVK